MKKILFQVLTFLFAIACTAATEKIMYGAQEKVKLLPKGITYAAKMDTGAKTSSLHVEEWAEFKKEGKPWIRFKVLKNTGPGRVTVTLERPLSRYVTIKPHPQAAVGSRRPVVLLTLCLGKVTREVEVNLAHRGHLTFPLLIGSQTISTFNGIIDPSEENKVPLQCD